MTDAEAMALGGASAGVAGGAGGVLGWRRKKRKEREARIVRVVGNHFKDVNEERRLIEMQNLSKRKFK